MSGGPGLRASLAVTINGDFQRLFVTVQPHAPTYPQGSCRRQVNLLDQPANRLLIGYTTTHQDSGVMKERRRVTAATGAA